MSFSKAGDASPAFLFIKIIKHLLTWIQNINNLLNKFLLPLKNKGNKKVISITFIEINRRIYL